MEKDKIFFGESGLTSTSANYIANVAKELYRISEETLDNMILYTTTVKLLGSSEESTLREGWSSVEQVEPILQDIAGLKSLISWLREAIKAKENLIKEAQDSTYEDYGLAYPEKPEREEYMSREDYIASLSVKQRNRYYYLEAVCATFGQYIHPGGVFANEREQLLKVIHEPHTLSGQGRDALLYTRMPSVNSQDVEDTFLHLQDVYRSYQAELNSIKHEIEEAVNKDTATKNIEYNEALKLYKYEMSQIDAELTMRRKDAVTAASNLKIIIPDSLQNIYEKVKNAGKKK